MSCVMTVKRGRPSAISVFNFINLTFPRICIRLLIPDWVRAGRLSSCINYSDLLADSLEIC